MRSLYPIVFSVLKFFTDIWKKTGYWRWIYRVPFKIAVLIASLLFAHYPNPILFLKNIRHLANPEMLIQSDASFLNEVNQEIDQMLPPNATPLQEFNVVQRYVYRKIPYEFDWNLWGNIDYWPTTQEVWDAKKEDCDGQSILTVSILRSRGFSSARLVGNIKHVWVEVDQKELMGPLDEKNFQGKKGRFAIAVPSINLLIDSISFYFREFPTARIGVLWFLILLLLFHPGKSLFEFIRLLPFNVAGFLFLLYWAQAEKTITLPFLIGFLLTLFSWILAYIQTKNSYI
ncbi:MAG: transglutaminase-like domain-containing protein [Planctomycetota bacterium]